MRPTRSGGARWAQLRERVLKTPQGARAYGEGWLQASDYRDTLRILDRARQVLGVSQSELARRLARRQPTVNRMLRSGADHSLSTVDAFLRGLGLAGTLRIEKAASKTTPGLQISARIRRAGTPPVARGRRVAARRKRSAA
jgi:ribosome-binding protein aMBF1 (putative translation factor)